MTTLLKKEEVARLLGLTVRSIERMVQDRRIPYIKCGKPVRFRQEDIDQWLQRRTVKTRAI